MKIFFSASNDVTKEVKEDYLKTIDLLKKGGYEVSQAIIDGISGKKLLEENDFSFIYDEVLKKIDDADVFVADISYPSGGVGYQVSHAVFQRKPVVIIYKQDGSTNPSVIIRGIKSKRVGIVDYVDFADLENKLPAMVAKAAGKIKVRFNLVMRASDYSFVEREAKRKGLSKTGYLLGMIKKARKESI